MSNTFSEQIATRARSYVNNPFSYGCTNFTCAVLAGAGAPGVRANDTIESLDTDTIGPRVGLDKVVSGDLIFFTDNLDRSGRAADGADRYVGIVDVDPDGKLWVIHTTGAGPSGKIQRVPIDAVAGPQPGGFSGALPSVDSAYQALGFRRVTETATTKDPTVYYGPNPNAPATPAPATPAPANPASVSHVIKDGDTIRSIAQEHGITRLELIASNPLVPILGLVKGDKLAIPTAAAPPADSAAESPPGEAYKPGEPLPSTPGENGAVMIDKTAVAVFIYKSLEGSPLIGMGQNGTTKMLADGAAYGLHTGSRKEWTRLILALIEEESGFNTNKPGDPGRFGEGGFLPGSWGLLQLSDRDVGNYKLPPLEGTFDERKAILRDPIFNIKLGLKIMTDLMTGKADATKNVNITRLGYSNPTNKDIQPSGANSVYESGAALGKYWSPFRGATFDSKDPTKIINTRENNIPIDSLAKGEEALAAALKIIQAEADQANQADREAPPPQPSPEPPVRSASGNRSNQQQNQNTRRESLKQPAPVQNELLYNSSTVINLPGGTMEVNNEGFGGGMGLASGNGAISIGDHGVKFSTPTGDMTTYAGGNTFNTTKGITSNSSQSTVNITDEDEEIRTGVSDYDKWYQWVVAAAPWYLGNTGFGGDTTAGPSLEDPMKFSLGYHDTLTDDSGNVPNPNNPTIAEEEIPSTLKLFYKVQPGQVLRFQDQDPNAVEYLGGEKADTPALIDPTGLNNLYQSSELRPIDEGPVNYLRPVPIRGD